MLLLQPAVLLLAGAICLFSAAAAAETGGGDEPPCMLCHKPSDTTIDPARYAQSVHGGLDCAMCHTDGFSTFPHGGTRTGAPDCGGCHAGSSPFDGIAKEVKESVHATAVDPAFRCTNCHSPHYFVPAVRMTDAAEAVRAANRPCLGCHATGDTQRQRQAALVGLAKKHPSIPHWGLHLRSAPCLACHADLRGAPGTTSLKVPIHKVLPAAASLKDCASCHGRNSLLATKLYAHLAVKEHAEQGWLNSVLFNTAYVTGATRNRWLDWATFGLTALTILGIGVHGAGRWLGARLRRRS